MISGLKNKVRARQQNKLMASYEGLAELRRERLRVEGQAKILDLQAQEKKKIASAKKQVMKSRFDNSIAGKVTKQINKGVKKAKDTKKKGNTFLPSGKEHPMFR